MSGASGPGGRRVRVALGALVLLLGVGAGLWAGTDLTRRAARGHALALRVRALPADLAALAATLTAAPRRAAALELDVAVAEAALPALEVGLAGLSLRARVDPRTLRPEGELRVETLRDQRRPRRVVPLRAQVRFAPAAEEEGAVDLHARVTDDRARLVVEARGRHRIAAGEGGARLRLEPLRVGEDEGDAVELAALVPALEDLVEAHAGTLEAAGELRWGPQGLSGRADLGVRGADLTTPLATIHRLDAAVRVEGPWPPTTPPGQLVSMARLDPGLPLDDGLVAFHLRRDGTLVLESARWHLAGGRVLTAGAVDLDAPEQHLELRVEDVDLGRLLQEVKLTGLSGEGTVGGRLPVVRTAEALVLRDGHLAARGPGWIRYEPPPGLRGALTGAAAVGGDVLVEVLRNFRYERLEVRLDGEARGDVHLRLHLAGANPDYRDGHPIEFNLDLEAELGDILRARDLSYRVPEEIEERLRRIGQEP